MQPCFLCRRQKLFALFALVLVLDLAETYYLTIRYVSSMCKLCVFGALATGRHPIPPSFTCIYESVDLTVITFANK
jgi:hypothetical protein